MKKRVISARYLAPKWQAYVTDDLGFGFVNGVRVRSLWELKEALLHLPLDVIQKHIGGRNDMAVWIREVIGDMELAEAVEQQNHRWGVIVALERQMMRTVNIPDYLAKRWLGSASFEFVFASGERVHSEEELGQALGKVADDVVSFHQERQPNDMACWVADAIGDYELAELLDEALTREQMKRYVEDHVVMLKEAME